MRAVKFGIPLSWTDVLKQAGAELLEGKCFGCALVAETSCEMRNDYLDRALVVPVLGLADAAFFRAQL